MTLAGEVFDWASQLAGATTIVAACFLIHVWIASRK